MIESVYQSIALAAAIIATLRAGSRALYSISNKNEIGIMDGPLILSPYDMKQLELEGKDVSCFEVSPLWELTCSFSEAVKLLHGAHRYAFDDFIEMNSWSDEKRQQEYLMSYPHRRRHNTAADGKIINRLVENNQDDVHNRNIIIKGDVFQKLKSPANFLKNGWKWMLKQSQMLIPRDTIYKHRLRQREITHALSDFENFQGIDPSDHEAIFSTTIRIPNSFESNSTKNETKYARIRSFAPHTFEKLRLMFGIKEDAFLRSILGHGPFVSFQSNSKGAARVGGFFFFTRDGTYMVKTIKRAEVKTILEMLPKYFIFMQQNARRSLLTRFCGLYSVQLSGENSFDDEHVFLIMNSVFPAEGSKFISERYDLKGSTVGRECSADERQMQGKQAVLKDLDLSREVSVMKALSPSFGLSDFGLSIGAHAKSALLSQLRRDLNLLISCSVMDYSLLVGVVNLECNDPKDHEFISKFEMTRETSKRQRRLLLIAKTISTPIRQLIAPAIFSAQFLRRKILATISTVLTPPYPYYGAGLCGVDGGSLSVLPGKRLGNRAIYYIGIIDFLQPWTTQKVLEKEFKGLLGYDKAAISCAHPKDYAERFLDFMDMHIT